MRTVSLAAIVCTAAAFVAPRRALSAPARSVARQALPETSLLLADLPTLVAPKDSELAIVFANPFFIGFFLFSITAGLPGITWLRLSSVGDDDAPFDLSSVVPTLPGLPELPEIPKTREIPLPFDKLPSAVTDKLPAELQTETKAKTLIDQLPWNKRDAAFRELLGGETMNPLGRYDFDFRSDKSKYSGNEKWVRDP